MGKTVSGCLVQRLYDWGIRRVFGFLGDGINGVMDALNRAGGKIRFVQARYEEMAAFTALYIATSGPVRAKAIFVCDRDRRECRRIIIDGQMKRFS